MTLSGRALQSLRGLDALESVGGHFEVSFTDVRDLSGPGKLATIGGPVLVHDNDSLSSAGGLQSLRQAGSSSAQGFIIADNRQLPTSSAEKLGALIRSRGRDGKIYGNHPS